MFADVMFGLFLVFVLSALPTFLLTRRLSVSLALWGISMVCLMVACATSYEIARITGIAGLLYQ